jgi:hypothetical protein
MPPFEQIYVSVNAGVKGSQEMNASDQQSPEINEPQRRINNILMSDNFLLISSTGEVVSRNISIEAIWPLLETVKFSLLSQYIDYCIDQRFSSGHSNPANSLTPGS